MFRTVALVVVALAVSSVVANGAFARSGTTTPGVIYTIKVVLTNSSISITHDRFTQHGVARYPRGAVIHYAITNRGKQPLAFHIWDVQTRPIHPGGNDSLLVNWNYRGEFPYYTLFKGKPAGPKGNVIIF